jgi:hypothetical protein
LYNLCTGHAYNEIRKQGIPNETDSSRKKKQTSDQVAGMQCKMKEKQKNARHAITNERDQIAHMQCKMKEKRKKQGMQCKMKDEKERNKACNAR